jgi:hypothetical protein
VIIVETTNFDTLSDTQLQAESLLQLVKLDLECQNLITETLVILNGKRETLEEKMIKTIFYKLANALSESIKVINLCCLEEKFPQHEKVVAASNLFEEIRLSVSELLKIVRYDLNFLEQYFEYDYCAKLHSEQHFVERVEAASIQLSKGLSQD